jgi:hypothetical protein
LQLESQKIKDHLKDLGIDGSTVLKLILHNVRMQMRLNWLSTQCGCRCL